SVQNLDPTLTDLSVPAVGYANHPTALHAAAADVIGDVADLTYTWTVVSPTTPAVTLTGADAVFTPTTAATYSGFVTVRDGDGGVVTSAVKTLTVRATPITLTQFNVPAAGQEGSPVRLSAGAVDALGGGPITFTWTVTPQGGTPFTLTGHDVP